MRNPRWVKPACVAILILASVIAAVAAAYFCGHAELLCTRVTATRVDAQFRVYRWFDQVPYDTVEIVGIRDAGVHEITGETWVSNWGESESDGALFFANDNDFLLINQFISKSRVGESVTIQLPHNRIGFVALFGTAVVCLFAVSRLTITPTAASREWGKDSGA